MAVSNVLNAPILLGQTVLQPKNGEKSNGSKTSITVKSARKFNAFSAALSVKTNLSKSCF